MSIEMFLMQLMEVMHPALIEAAYTLPQACVYCFLEAGLSKVLMHASVRV